MSTLCPRCGEIALRLYGTDTAVCLKCGGEAFATVPVETHQRHGDAPERVPDTNVPPPTERLSDSGAWLGPECELVEAIRTDLQAHGYIVLRVGQRRADKGGSDFGVPDLLVRYNGDEWGCALWIGMECKTARGRLSDDRNEADTHSWSQRMLADADHTIVVRSVADARQAVGLT